jgi:hypothetical protein
MRQRPRPDDCSACAVARFPGPLATNTAGRLRPSMRTALVDRPPAGVGWLHEIKRRPQHPGVGRAATGGVSALVVAEAARQHLATALTGHEGRKPRRGTRGLIADAAAPGSTDATPYSMSGRYAGMGSGSPPIEAPS